MHASPPRLQRPALALTAALFGLAGAAVPAAADYNQVIAFRAATPKCEANPTLPWIGRASGQTTSLMSDLMVPVSFVGCFATEAECRKWLGHGIGLIDGRIVENSCRPR
jgi:hypothetical protein